MRALTDSVFVLQPIRLHLSAAVLAATAIGNDDNDDFISSFRPKIYGA